MAFDRLNYGRDWTRPQDFPTFEDSESQVRADLQYHPDAVKAFLNDVLLPALEGDSGALEIGTADGRKVQTVLDKLEHDLAALMAGQLPDVEPSVQVAFGVDDWEQVSTEGSGTDHRISVRQEVHKRVGPFGVTLWQMVDGVLTANTWGPAGTTIAAPDGPRGPVVLTSPTPYAGAAVFYGT